MIARLRNEAALVGPVQHPNVCRVFDYVMLQGRHTLVMEFIGGLSLAAQLARPPLLPLEVARRIGRDICAGVAALHAAGVLHRDLKPENVLIESGDGREGHPARGLAKLIDFGSVERIGAPPTPGAGIGTPAYMAPEQLARGETSVASDVYSLGLVLVELLTGQRDDRRLPQDLGNRPPAGRFVERFPTKRPAEGRSPIEMEQTLASSAEKTGPRPVSRRNGQSLQAATLAIVEHDRRDLVNDVIRATLASEPSQRAGVDDLMRVLS